MIKIGTDEMKKIFFVLLSLLLIFYLSGCGNKEKQDTLLNYINEDLMELSKIETEFLESYASVSGDNYTSDYAMYEEFSNNTMILARRLNDEAVKSAQNIDDEEILEVHRIYMNLTSNYMDFVVLALAAIEAQDVTQLLSANEKISNANNLSLDFKKELNALAEKYNIVIEEE